MNGLVSHKRLESYSLSVSNYCIKDVNSLERQVTTFVCMCLRDYYVPLLPLPQLLPHSRVTLGFTNSVTR